MKKGVSLIVLVITVLILAILVAMVSIPGADVLKNSKLAAFYEDITKIQDAVTSYKITRGYIPIKENTQVLTLQEVLNLVADEKRTFLSQEIVANLDNNSEFYYIDVSKIGLQNITIDDTKIICNTEGTHVYYLNGFQAEDMWYFTVGKEI
ncbi:MAG: hypothetical protein IKV94_00415 [Clostridia bacterium]|nr:hypothetical protein [Clostridia bacterium]